MESGADALSLINTLLGMRINIRTGEPVITHVTGGVSGPAVLPVGLAAVWRVRAALPEIPIIGIGGIDSGETALEYLYAGANAVEVGAAALFEPTAPLRVARDTWPAEIQKWDHLKGLTYSVAVGTEAERRSALQKNTLIHIINRENVQWLIEQSGLPFQYDMLVIDELSSFKSHQAKRFRALMRMRPRV